MGAIFSKSDKDDALLFFCLDQEEKSEAVQADGRPTTSNSVNHFSHHLCMPTAPGREPITPAMNRHASMRKVQVVSKAEDQFLEQFKNRMATAGLKAKQVRTPLEQPYPSVHYLTDGPMRATISSKEHQIRRLPSCCSWIAAEIPQIRSI